jgi:hypothetical protein
MTNEVKIGGIGNQIETINQAETINITEKPFLRELKERLDQTFSELEQVSEAYPAKERVALRKDIATFRRGLREHPERLNWVQEMLEQMTCLDTEPGLEKVPKLIQFFLLLQAAQCTYTLEKEQAWVKVYCAREQKTKKFELFDSRGLMNHSIRIIGPQVVRFLLESGFPMGVSDLALIWRNDYDCALECQDPNGIFPVIVQNFTDVTTYQEENPSFFDDALRGQLHITCGTCLMDIYRKEKGLEILERMFAL